MKIRLIQPADLHENGDPKRFKKLFLPSLTLPTLAALTPGDIDVRITDDYIQDIDFDEDVDLVGLTGLTSQAPRAYQIADEFRRRGKKTIMGGIHASFCTDEALEHVDSVFVGEAEDTWEEVIEDARSDNLKRVYRAERPADLSKLAIPRFDLLRFTDYVIPPFAKTPLIPIQTTRGCPHYCDFCSVTAFLGHSIRKKPIDHVLKEISTFKPSRIFFADDNIAADPGYAKELFKAIKPLKIRWACQMSTTIIKDPELIELAAASGCHETFIGVESITRDSLNAVHKGFNKIEEYKELFRLLKNVGILAQASFVFGLDGDSVESLRKTIERVLDWDVNYMHIFILTPLPGTRLRRKMEEESRITKNDWSFYDVMHPVIRFKGLTSQELIDSVWQAYQRFYSVSNILKRVWRFKKQYIVFFPRDLAFEEVFFQFLIRRSVRVRQHPFTLGFTATKSKRSGFDGYREYQEDKAFVSRG